MKDPAESSETPEFMPDLVVETLIALYPDVVARAHAAYYRASRLGKPLDPVAGKEHEAFVAEVTGGLEFSEWELACLGEAVPLDCVCAHCLTLPPWKERFRARTGISWEDARRELQESLRELDDSLAGEEWKNADN
jgi:hypothetical protein